MVSAKATRPRTGFEFQHWESHPESSERSARGQLCRSPFQALLRSLAAGWSGSTTDQHLAKRLLGYHPQVCFGDFLIRIGKSTTWNMMFAWWLEAMLYLWLLVGIRNILVYSGCGAWYHIIAYISNTMQHIYIYFACISHTHIMVCIFSALYLYHTYIPHTHNVCIYIYGTILTNITHMTDGWHHISSFHLSYIYHLSIPDISYIISYI